MVELEYIGDAGDGFIVHIAGRAPRFMRPNEFLDTFGESEFERHVLSDVSISSVSDHEVICTPTRFPRFEVVWPRTETGELDEGRPRLLRHDGQPVGYLSSATPCSNASWANLEEVSEKTTI
jgi:hypothetical protein